MHGRRKNQRFRSGPRRTSGTGFFAFGRRWRLPNPGCETTPKPIALTFDDGPDPTYTPQILEVLNKYRVPATFFLLGRNVDAYPDIALQIAEQGHAIGNHGYSHRRFPRLSSAELAHEILACDEAVLRATGQRTTLVRPPFGHQTAANRDLICSMGYRSILWTAPGVDWKGDPAEWIVYNVLARARQHGIILLHDGWEPPAAGRLGAQEYERLRDRTPTIQALPIILEELDRRGIEFVTVPELLSLGSPMREQRPASGWHLLPQGTTKAGPLVDRPLEPDWQSPTSERRVLYLVLNPEGVDQLVDLATGQNLVRQTLDARAEDGEPVPVLDE